VNIIPIGISYFQSVQSAQRIVSVSI